MGNFPVTFQWGSALSALPLTPHTQNPQQVEREHSFRRAGRDLKEGGGLEKNILELEKILAMVLFPFYR